MNETTTANRSAAEATVRHLYGRLMDGWNRPACRTHSRALSRRSRNEPPR
jgi:hypothetical protein